MKKERLDHYMDLAECARKLKDGLGSGMSTEDYQFYCAVILEKMHQEYEKAAH